MALPPEFFAFVAIGLAAQLVDGALGMAYGLTASSLLQAFGVPPAIASATVHAAEMATTFVSGATHGMFGNVDWDLVRRLAFPGMLGGGLGAWVLGSVDWPWLRAAVAAWLVLMGALLLWRAIQWQHRKEPRSEKVTLLGFSAGAMDAIGGGGWGSLTTTRLMARHLEPRIAVGTANAAEFFVTVAISAVFLGTIGFGYLPMVGGLLVGGVVGAPLAALFAKRLPARGLLGTVGVVVMGLSAYNLVRALSA
jgi:uncharacterized membrane protein YfcA